MRKVSAIAAALALLGLGIAAQAITIETVAVGDKGNAGDTRVMTWDGTTGYGAVSYNYNIGKYEVTAGQYTAFLNAVAATDTYRLYNTGMSNASNGCGITRSGTAGSYRYSVANDFVNRPVNNVNYWHSCRFANWLCNGQPTGAENASTTERGAYTLDGYNGQDGRNIQRNAGATWAVTSEDEWYKAAYYKGGGTNAGYWLYPTMSNAAPANQVLATDPGNSANYYINNYSIGSPYYRTIVGEFENSASAYGTFDQGGNVWEWTEGKRYDPEDHLHIDYTRAIRGGSFASSATLLQASDREGSNPYGWNSESGFRVVGFAAVPEPSSLIALLGGVIGLLGIRRRRG